MIGEHLNSLNYRENSLFIEDKSLKKEIAALKLGLTLKRSDQNAGLIINTLKEGRYEVLKSGNRHFLKKDELIQLLENMAAVEKNKDRIKKSQKNINSFLKGKLQKNNIKRFFKNSTEYYQDVIKTLIQSEKIEELPLKLSKLKVFKPYHSFITILLQKGSSKSLVCDLGKSNRLKKYYFDSREFNNVYSAIKKSKSPYFYEHKVISKSLKLVGCFLAKTFTLKTHNLVVIISKDDFIPPSNEEIDVFNEFSFAIEKALNFIELKNIIFSDLHLYLSTLYQLDYYISIMDNNLLIAGNSDNSNFDKSFTPSWSNLKIQYSNPSNRFTSTDLFHYQRIKLLGELFNILKHELSNPIFGIKMSLDLLMNESIEKDPKEILEQITDSADRSLEILNSMTDIFSNEKKEVTRNLDEILSKVYTLCKSELKLIDFKILYAEEAHKEVKVQTNITFLTQILFNLLINATQELKKAFPNPRERKLILSPVISDNYVEILITDNGRGIKPEEQDKIFQLFFSKKSTGNGIGLPLSRTLAQKLGGDLLLQSSEPGSTTFILLVPVCTEE